MEDYFQYMIAVVRLLCAQKWKDSTLPSMEKWLVTLVDFAEMDTLISLIREKTPSTFIGDWKPFMDILCTKWQKFFGNCPYLE